MPRRMSHDIPNSNLYAARVYFTTESEYRAVRERAKGLGMPLSKFIRECIMARMLPSTENPDIPMIADVGIVLTPEQEKENAAKEYAMEQRIKEADRLLAEEEEDILKDI